MGRPNIMIGVLAAIACEFIFGLSYMTTKFGMESASSLALLGWRFFVAFIAMSLAILFGIIKIDLRGKPIRPLLMVAIFSPTLYFIGETLGISHTTASESGVFLACIPIASLLASTIFLKKKPTKNQLIGILITLSGALFTVLSIGMESSLSLLGYLFLLIAVLSNAFYSVLVEKAVSYTSIEITYVMLVVGASVFGLIAFIEALINKNLEGLVCLPFRKPAFGQAILYQGIVCSLIGFFLSNIAISRLGVNKTASFIGVSTVVSILSGTLMLGEKFSGLQIFGAGLILIGVYRANIGDR